MSNLFWNTEAYFRKTHKTHKCGLVSDSWISMKTGKPRSLNLRGELGPNMATSFVIGCLGHRIGRHV